ncbi:sigma-E factor regulatory protein RseB domain-containing protein [Streptosporangium sp. DT93]|uniref:sigma-E factor regulatory protein RseB domain-containing protein n=1 Tax=Streptosporangium sp. DT93 TaxID=3393428 RepID=UPI003CEADE26
MTRLPVTLFLAALMLLGPVAGGPAHADRSSRAVPPDDAESEDTGLTLLREAAIAGRSRGYAGTRYVSVWGASGSTSAVQKVRNVPGGGMTVRAEPSGQEQSADPGTIEGGLSSPSETMLEVLARNYRVLDAGEGHACGRTARLVDVLRADGTLAARYWIDHDAGPVLRRELLDARGRIVHTAAFVDLTVQPAAPGRGAAPATSAGSTAPAMTMGGLDLAETPRLLAGGWRFPPALPGGLELFAAHRAPAGHVYLGYSDGLSIVSVFIQRGALDEERLRDWHAERRNGHTIWIRDPVGQETIWASGGHVYTVFADAPADMAAAAVAALPHEPVPDLWTRLGRGASRVLSWVNPFE